MVKKKPHLKRENFISAFRVSYKKYIHLFIFMLSLHFFCRLVVKQDQFKVKVLNLKTE